MRWAAGRPGAANEMAGRGRAGLWPPRSPGQPHVPFVGRVTSHRDLTGLDFRGSSRG